MAGLRETNKIPGPPPAETIVMELAFQGGRAYIAPVGSSLEIPDAWIRVQSLADIAERVGVTFED